MFKSTAVWGPNKEITLNYNVQQCDIKILFIKLLWKNNVQGKENYNSVLNYAENVVMTKVYILKITLWNDHKAAFWKSALWHGHKTAKDKTQNKLQYTFECKALPNSSFLSTNSFRRIWFWTILI